MHRYNNVEFILQTDVETGASLIRKAQDEERDSRLFQQWVVQLPWMDKEHFMSFADYKNRVTGANIDRRSVAAIMADLDEAERELQRGGE